MHNLQSVVVNRSVSYFSGFVSLWDRAGAVGGISQQWSMGQLITLVGKADK